MLAHAIQVVLFLCANYQKWQNIKEIILKENTTTNNDKYEKAINALVEKEVSQPLSPIQRVAAALWLKNNDIIETIKSVLRVLGYDDNYLKKMSEWNLKKTLLEEIAQDCHYKFFTSPLGLWRKSDLKKRIGWIDAEELKGEIAQLNMRNPIIHHADMKSTFVYNKKKRCDPQKGDIGNPFSYDKIAHIASGDINIYKKNKYYCQFLNLIGNDR